MSLPQFSAVDCPSSQPHQQQQQQCYSGPAPGDHRASSKRKLDDYALVFEHDDDDDDEELPLELVSSAVRMRKDDSLSAVFHFLSDGQNQSSLLSANYLLNPRAADGKLAPSWSLSASSSSSSSAASSSMLPLPCPTLSTPRLQFFIRMISEGSNTVIHANYHDTVKSIHERIQATTGIPMMEQRLIYNGRQLQWEQSLADCAIQNDAVLHLVGRMRSTKHPQTCQVTDDMVSFIFRLCRARGLCHQKAPKHIMNMIDAFFELAFKDEKEEPAGHVEVFLSSSVPAALVMLYISSVSGNKECADESIRHFLSSCREPPLPKNLHIHCAPIVLEFCKLLRKVGNENPLYLSCRNTLGSIFEDMGDESFDLSRSGGKEDLMQLIAIPDIFPFVSELADCLSRDLIASLDSQTSLGPLMGDVHDFSAFLLPLRTVITEQLGFQGPISLPLKNKGFSHLLYADEIEKLHDIFIFLLMEMDRCLLKMEDSLILTQNGERESMHSGWSQYLAILKELYTIAKLYKGAEEKFWMVLRNRKGSLCVLIVRYAKRTDDHQWLLQSKDVTDFESRRHLALMMFAEMKEDYEELHEMLIDRSQLLAESFEYIVRADPETLHTGLFMEFKNEEATGPGVLREWFFLVAQAIFNPQNALFVACPNDRRRFYPNPASKVDPMHLDYFTFSGRVIALALMHRVQMGIVLDRVFFLQLAGKNISLEDTQDADPCFYNSCKQILEMDAEFIDSDALGLTFIREVEELGSRRVVELCPGGKGIVVNSQNRAKYVNLLIEHRFVTSISQQVHKFAQGFGDILSTSRLQKFFFQSLELEDLDWMLHGSERPIDVEDWKAHTEYNGYKETDPQISWFWKVCPFFPCFFTFLHFTGCLMAIV
uniref:HECT-type E3 ubiquitin transferase n=1 Tax=Rhizophora mucronata TaxID=61149 RepID=A0A2P2JSA9_RHIMU